MEKYKPKRSKPWYERTREYFIMGTNYLLSYGDIDYKKRNPSLINFERETLARFIFESNNIEKEGLPLHETRELVIGDIEYLPGIKEIIEKKLMSKMEIRRFDPDKMNKTTNDDEEVYGLIAKHGKKTREVITAIQHLTAVQEGQIIAMKSRISRRRRFSYFQALEQSKSDKPATRRHAIDFLNREYPSGKPPRFISLFTERRLKFLHFLMAAYLINPRFAPAGDYRNHPIITDYKSHYPAPEVISKAMKVFIKNFKQAERSLEHPFTLAARVSTQFVLIHPFSDFNGRMSRLIINMILRAYGLPFWIALRSSKKERRRYLTALKHYRRGKLNSIVALIAKQVCDEFSELCDVLSLSEQEIILEPKVIDSIGKFDDKHLFSFRWIY